MSEPARHRFDEHPVVDVESLRQRCVIDRRTGCWHLKRSHDGAAFAYTPRLYVPGHTPGSARRLVWLLAHGTPPPAGMVVTFSCSSIDCVLPAHLVLRTRAEALLRIKAARGDALWAAMQRNGCAAYKERQRTSSSKLTPEAVRAIRASHEATSALAAQHGVSRQSIARVRALKSWRFVR